MTQDQKGAALAALFIGSSMLTVSMLPQFNDPNWFQPVFRGMAAIFFGFVWLIGMDR